MATRRSNESRPSSQSSVGTGERAAETATSAPPRSTRKRASASKPQTATASGSTVSADVRRGMIAEAAYLRAERRGFVPGHEDEDWLAAEKEVDAQLASGRVWGGPQ